MASKKKGGGSDEGLFRKDPQISKCGYSQKGHLLASGTLELGNVVKLVASFDWKVLVLTMGREAGELIY